MTRALKRFCIAAPIVYAALATVLVLAGLYTLTGGIMYEHPDTAELEKTYDIPCTGLELVDSEYDLDLNYLTLTARIPDPAGFETALESRGWQRKPTPPSGKPYFTRTENGVPDSTRLFIHYRPDSACIEAIIGCTPKWNKPSIDLFLHHLNGAY